MLDYLAGLVAGDGSITIDELGRARIRVFDASRRFLENICMLITTDLGYSCRIH